MHFLFRSIKTTSGLKHWCLIYIMQCLMANNKSRKIYQQGLSLDQMLMFVFSVDNQFYLLSCLHCQNLTVITRVKLNCEWLAKESILGMSQCQWDLFGQLHSSYLQKPCQQAYAKLWLYVRFGVFTFTPQLIISCSVRMELAHK